MIKIYQNNEGDPIMQMVARSAAKKVLEELLNGCDCGSCDRLEIHADGNPVFDYQRVID